MHVHLEKEDGNAKLQLLAHLDSNRHELALVSIEELVPSFDQIGLPPPAVETGSREPPSGNGVTYTSSAPESLST